MPRVAQGQRKRAYTPKTRTGCITCRIRHVKCDEEKPNCKKCTSTGRKCDGYSHVSPTTSTRSSKSPSAQLSRSPAELCGTGRENRSFTFFLKITAPQLTGFDGESFWDRFVLQATHHEPAIRHAIIALGSLHEKFMRRGGVLSHNEVDDFALQQYGSAIKCLVQPFSQKKQPAMDLIQANFGQAMAHIQSGSKILCEIKYNEQTRQNEHDVLTASSLPYVPMDILLEIYLRLDFQLGQMLGAPSWSIYQKTMENRPNYNVPTVFSSLSEARESLIFNHQTYSLSLMGVSELDDEHHAAGFATWQLAANKMLDQWSYAFDQLLEARMDTMTENDKRGAYVLQIHRVLTRVAALISRGKSDNQLLWDEFPDAFRTILSLVEKVIQKDSGNQPSFSMDMQIIGPLYEIIGRCRDPTIRRKAIELLESAPRQEGIWNSFLTAKVARRVMEIEEEGLGEIRCAEDVPLWARISEVEPIFDQEARRAKISYTRLGSDGCSVAKRIEEIVEW
ncbi:hypothetical protein BGZ60DRAFT_468234 [Tricladium varicosporioides]|nr:hypothetical protein BGZ60DRAFT_468234 [Hymenoscyphus varicosporioides]